jgi:hypothetical protein
MDNCILISLLISAHVMEPHPFSALGTIISVVMILSDALKRRLTHSLFLGLRLRIRLSPRSFLKLSTYKQYVCMKCEGRVYGHWALISPHITSPFSSLIKPACPRTILKTTTMQCTRVSQIEREHALARASSSHLLAHRVAVSIPPPQATCHTGINTSSPPSRLIATLKTHKQTRDVACMKHTGRQGSLGVMLSIDGTEYINR